MNNPKVRIIPINKIHPFVGHPYKVLDNEEMAALAESIRTQGVLLPLIVRPLENTADEYEAISGHRRLFASEKAGLETVPAFVYEMNRDQAAVVVVDSNLHRDHLLPSEKAFAYKLKLEAIKHQGKRVDDTSRQVVGRLESADEVSDEDSGRQVQRYIRLTYLVPEMLDLVDEGRIALTPAVHLSYLTDEEQRWVLNEMARNDCTPSVSQALCLKRRSMEETLSKDFVEGLMCQEKANQRENIRIPMERLKGKIPEACSTQQREDFIVKACDYYRNHLKKQRDTSL